MNTRALVVEDETDLAQILVDYCLKRDGFAATYWPMANWRWRNCAAPPPSLLLLDLMLPGMDGLSILRELRKTSMRYVDPWSPPKLRKSRSDFDRSCARGRRLHLQPYSPREVVARVKTVLRRTQQVPATSSNRDCAPDRDRWRLLAGPYRRSSP